MKNSKSSLITLSVLFGIMTAIYFPIYINIVGADGTSMTGKIVATIILLALISTVVTGVVLAILKLKQGNGDALNNDTKNENNVVKAAVSTLIGIGVFAIVVVAILVFFFMSISG